MDTQSRKYVALLRIIAITALFLLMAQAYSLLTVSRQAVRQEARDEQARILLEARGATVRSLILRQQTVIGDLYSDYATAAYRDSSIDRISEQQLRAAEFQLQALQVIALQNTQILELLLLNQ